MVNDYSVLSVGPNASATDIIQTASGALVTTVRGGDSTYITGVHSGGDFSLNNGVASNFLLGISSARQSVESGGVAQGTVVYSSAGQNISEGGLAQGTILSNRGIQRVSSGGSAVSAQIYGGGTQIIFSGGKATGTEVFAGGSQRISSGAVAESTYLASGAQQTIEKGGSSIRAQLASGATINLTVQKGDTTVMDGSNEAGASFFYSNGVASNFLINYGGFQNISSGGSSINLQQNKGGQINVMVVAGDTTKVVGTNQSGEAMVLSNGVASNFIITSGASHIVSSGGSSYNVQQLSGGYIYTNTVSAGNTTVISGINAQGKDFYVSGNKTSNFLLNSRQSFGLGSGAIADNTYLMSSANLQVSNGAVANSTYITSSGAQVVSSGGVASGTRVSGYMAREIISSGGRSEEANLLNSGIQHVYSGATANSTQLVGINAQQIVSGGTANDAYLSGADSQYKTTKQVLYSGGVANRTQLNDGAVQVVNSTTQANSTIVSSGGRIEVNEGGKALDIVQLAGGNVNTDVVQGGTYITGRNEYTSFSLLDGVAYDFVLNNGGEQNVSSGGITSRTVINSGGVQLLAAVGSSYDTKINEGGEQILSSGGISFDTVLNGGTQTLYLSGTAQNTVASAGSQILSSGGVANSAVVLSNAVQIVAQAGNANETMVSGGQQNVLTGGVTSHSLLYAGGTQNVASGGVAAGTEVLSKGSQNLSSGALANSTVISKGGVVNVLTGGSSYEIQQLAGGIINANVDGTDSTTNITGTNQYGSAFALKEGVASNMVLNTSSVQDVLSAGKAYNTAINGGVQNVLQTGETEGTVLLAGTQNVSGTARATTIEGGVQNVNTSALSTVIIGGTQNALSGATVDKVILAGGVQNVYAGADVTSVVVHGTGVQNVLAGAQIQAVNLSSAGTQNVAGSAADTVINGGVQNVSAGGTATGSILNGGSQNVFNSGTAEGTVISAGTQNISGTVVNTTMTGGTQNIYAGGLAVNTEATNARIDIQNGARLSGLTASSTLVNVYGTNSLEGRVSLEEGTVVNLADATVGQQVTMQDLSANSAVFNMNVDLEQQTADSLYITNSYNGQSVLNFTNVASTALPTDQTGIKVVEFGEGATVNGKFSLVGGQWDEGGYVYKLGQGNPSGTDQDYYLRNTGNYTDTFKMMLNIPLMNVMLARTGMNSLQTRLGNLHSMDNSDKTQGVWVRSYYKDLTVEELTKTDMRMFGAEAGYDWLFFADAPTKLYAGVMLGYIQADNIKTKKENGAYDKGDGLAPSVGVYATLINEDSWFVDIAARNFWTKLDMTSFPSNGEKLNYEPERNIITASVETGKLFITPTSQGRFLRIEPKAEINYMNAAADKAVVESGLGDLEYEDTHYLNAKAALLIGYNVRRSNGLLIEPLLELAYRYEFMGKGDVSYGGANHTDNLRGGILEASAALNMQLTDNLYWYIMGTYEAGDKIKGWGGNLGIRYAFGGAKPVTDAPSLKKTVTPTVQKPVSQHTEQTTSSKVAEVKATNAEIKQVVSKKQGTSAPLKQSERKISPVSKDTSPLDSMRLDPQEEVSFYKPRKTVKKTDDDTTSLLGQIEESVRY